ILDDRAAAGAGADADFAAPAERVCTGLDRAGFQLCPGEAMATNPPWRRTWSDWEQTVRGWVGATDAASEVHSRVFFDLRAVDGEAALAERVRRETVVRSQGSPRFQARLARIACDWQPPLGFLRGLVVARRGEYRNTLDLKAGGVAPVVQIARLYA